MRCDKKAQISRRCNVIFEDHTGELWIGIDSGLYRYRVNQLLAIERLRTRLAADLHDEIAGNLSSIAMFGKIIQDEAAAAGEKKLAGSELIKAMQRNSQRSVVQIRPHGEESPSHNLLAFQ